MNKIELLKGDCLVEMSKINDKSIPIHDISICVRSVFLTSGFLNNFLMLPPYIPILLLS